MSGSGDVECFMAGGYSRDISSLSFKSVGHDNLAT